VRIGDKSGSNLYLELGSAIPNKA